MLREKLVVRQFARANDKILEGVDLELDATNTENNLEIMREADERKLPRMANIHDFVEMWQGSQNLCATQMESHAQNREMTATGYISDTKQIIKASWSLFQHIGVAVFKLSEQSSLPPTLTANNLSGGRTQILNVGRIRRIHCHPIQGDEYSVPEHILDTKDWLNCNGDMDNAYDSEDDWVADVESGKEQSNGIENLDCPEQWDVSATPNVPGLIRPTR